MLVISDNNVKSNPPLIKMLYLSRDTVSLRFDLKSEGSTYNKVTSPDPWKLNIN